MTIELENVTCPLCGRDNSKIVASGIDSEYQTSQQSYNFIECGNCRLIYLKTRPKISEAATIYPVTYHSVNKYSPLHSNDKVDGVRENLDRKRCRDLLSVLQPGDTVLDIGCGDARMLKVFKKFGPDNLNLVGIDINIDREFIERKKREGISIIDCPLEEFNLAGFKKIKVVIMNEIVEHLWNFSTCFQKLSKELQRGTYLSIETPDIDCLSRKLFSKQYWGGYHIPRHLQLFSKPSLALFLKSRGFKIIRHYNILAPSFWIITIRNICGLNSYGRSKSLFEFLNFKNFLALSVFTALDFVLGRLGIATACQRLIAIKEDS
jgi:2-polyprenyl-3-methyl-5-hydroxy-6-metoxy-1,4-benzoquinol methylase